MHSKFLPMQLAPSHHCEMVLTCWCLVRQNSLGEGSESPTFPFRIEYIYPSISGSSSRHLQFSAEALVLGLVLDLRQRRYDGPALLVTAESMIELRTWEATCAADSDL